MLTLAIPISIADEPDEDTQDGLLCASNYLKEKSLMDSKFSVKFTSSDVSEQSCSIFLDSFKKSFYETMDKEVRSDKDLAEVADCIGEKSKEVELADLAVKTYVYDGVENMPKYKRKKAMKTIERALEKKTETIVKVCAATKTFGDMFDGLCKAVNEDSSSSESDEKSPLDDYCIRKYLTENNYINTTIHRIDLNPNNIDVTGADCDKIVKKAKAEAINELKKEFDEEGDFVSRHSKRCLKKSLHESKYFETAGKAIVLCEITLTPEIKEFERGQFIADMGKLYEAIYLC